MKKLFIIASAIVIFSTNSAIAKTEGNYLGVYGMLAKITPKDQSSTIYQVSRNANRQIRGGFNYQYAFNFNDFFLSPEVFIDALSLSNKAEGGSDKLTINTRYGIKANIGYDVNEKFSPYLSFGAATAEYSSQKLDNSYSTITQSGSRSSAIYGIGTNIRIHENLVANLEYNMQNLTLSQGTGDGLGNYKTRINTFRFGVSYNF